MSIISKFLTIVTEPEFKLARDLTAMAIADGQITPEEKEAIRTICHLEGISETKLLEVLQGGYDKVNEEMPKTRQNKEEYLRDIIKLIGSDGNASPQEVYLFQIIAGKMGLNQMDVVGLFLLTASHRYFEGDAGAKILASFLRNHIDPKGKSEQGNRDNLRTIFDTIASHTKTSQNSEANREVLQHTLSRATETFLENKILVKEFKDVGLDFAVMVKQEEEKVLARYV